MAIYNAQPMTGAWAGMSRSGTTGVPWWGPTSPAGSASSATGCARGQDGRRATEVAIAAEVLNPMLEFGRPVYVRIA